MFLMPSTPFDMTHSLKLECEKLAQDKTEMQRHYVMYYEMSYGLNVEMHKQVSERHDPMSVHMHIQLHTSIRNCENMSS